MNNSDRLGRHAVTVRWMACLGAGAVIAASYLVFQPLRAAERGPAAAAKAPTEKTEAATGGPSAITPEDRFKAAMSEKEPAKGETKPAPTDSSTKEFNLLEVVQKGGIHMWAVYAILAVSVVTVAFALERVLGLRRSKVLPSALMATMRALAAQKGGFDPRQAYKICRQHPSSAATVLKTVLLKVGRPIVEIERAASEASDREASRLYANVRWQNLAFNLAPMLGLAGTVWGVTIAFFQTATLPLGANKMETLASGIYAALVCTFAGLVVAIPAGVLAHLFEGRIMNMFRDLDDLVIAMMPQLERFEGRPRPGSKAQADKAPPAAGPITVEPVARETVVEPVADRYSEAR